MALPIKYTPLPSPAVATINYIDLAEGISIFNGCSTEGNTLATETYLMTTGSPYSHLVSSSGSLAAIGDTFEIDFDSGVLNRPMLIKGNAYASFSWRCRDMGASSNSWLNFPFMKLRKWDGVTETEIMEVSGSAIFNGSGGIVALTMLQLSNIPTTLIKSGERIRLTIGVQRAGGVGLTTPRAFLAHDPQNRADDWFTTGNFPTTKLIIGIPSKIT